MKRGLLCVAALAGIALAGLAQRNRYGEFPQPEGEPCRNSGVGSDSFRGGAGPTDGGRRIGRTQTITSPKASSGLPESISASPFICP